MPSLSLPRQAAATAAGLVVAAALALCVTIVALGRGGLHHEPALLLSKRQSTILAVSKGLQKLQISPKVSVLAARSLSQFHSLCKSPTSLATVTRSEMQRRRRRADSNWWNVIKAFKVFPPPSTLHPPPSTLHHTLHPTPTELSLSLCLSLANHTIHKTLGGSWRRVGTIFLFPWAGSRIPSLDFCCRRLPARHRSKLQDAVVSQTLFPADGRRGAERSHGRPQARPPAHLCGPRVVPLQPNANRGAAKEL